MDIYHLRSFVVLAEHRHFGRAAQALHVSQPALTKQIRRLEEELGSSLFEREPTGARLSAVGQRWLPEAQAVITRFDQAVAFAHKSARGTVGQLRVGFGAHTLELVPKLVAKLRESAPDVQITLRDMSSAEQASALSAGQLDVGFMRMPIPDAARYKHVPIIEDRLALVVPVGTKLSGKRWLIEFRDTPFVSISRNRSPGFFNHVLDLCAAYGFHPRIVQEVHEFPTAIALVRAGMGVTMIPESLWTSRIPGVEMHRLEDRRAVWKVATVWRRGDTNPVLANLIRLLP